MRHATDEGMVPVSEAIELEEENARLRLLVGRIWPVVEHPARWCHDCPHGDTCMETSAAGTVRHGCQWREDVRGMASELGIEVDG